MELQANENSRTRRSLIERIKNREDQHAWDDFAATYQTLILGVARKCGLREIEAEEVVQETMISVSKNIDKFNADPAFGSFRTWLLLLTRWRIGDQLRKRRHGGPHGAGSRFANDENQSGTSAEERIADPNGNQFEAIWDEEERNALVNRALEKLKRQVRPEHFQIFHLYAVKGLPAAAVAEQLGASRLNIYQVYRRLSRMFLLAQADLRKDFA